MYGPADPRAQVQQRKVAEMEEKEGGALPPVVIAEPRLEPGKRRSRHIRGRAADPVEPGRNRVGSNNETARGKPGERTGVMNQAKFKVELLKAELSGDPTQVAKVKLNQAELELERVSKLHAEKLVSEQEMSQAKFNLELRRAELAGDRAKAARVQLAQAEDAFRHASKLREQKLISEDDYNQRKTELELWQRMRRGCRMRRQN